MADIVVVTGASKGIGLATAKRLAADGVTVIGLARSEPEDFPGIFLSVDLGDEAATAETMDRIVRDNAVDGIVNNLGLNLVEPLGEVDLDRFHRVMDVNLRVTVQCTQALLPGMRERRYGRIVNLSSRAARSAGRAAPATAPQRPASSACRAPGRRNSPPRASP